ncbi:YitT family protein [Desulfogranum japonicum]|uniref:YitT family protein n=1 Tax=Desulfogranum japonicum TaxID=231447 RepID=UPI00048A71DD|nr:YitT family protein [Desulfogranum japonicum]
MVSTETFKNIIWNLILITSGSIIFAFGAKAVLVHHSFIMGGLFGTALLISYQTSCLSPGMLYLLMNIPVMIMGYLFVSRRFFLYSLYAVGVVTLASECIHYDLQVQQQLYAAIVGGIICGAGSGIILRSVGSGGGLDIVAVILNQKFNLGIGKFYFFYNALLFSFTLTLYEIDLVVASLILTFISTTAMEYVLTLFNQRKVVYILSDYGRAIADIIINELKQGVTIINAQGAYSGKDKKMLMTVTNNLQIKRLEERVFTLDPNALFIVENSFNVIGSGLGKRKIY